MKHLIVAAAFAASTAAPSLMAAVYANASLSNIQYKVVDLDLNDNIDPSVTFSSSGSNLYGYIYDYYTYTDGFNQSSTLNDLTSATVSDSLNSASASINYNNLHATNLQASGSSLGTNTDAYGYFYSQSYDHQYYTLSPNTRLEFTVDSNLFVESTSSGDYEFVYASNQFYAYDYLNGYYNFNTYSQLYSDYYDPKAVSEMKTVSNFIDNISSQESNGYLNNYAYVYGATYAEPSAVPVPAALPLMASALGVFGIARRRNKAKAKASL